MGMTGSGMVSGMVVAGSGAGTLVGGDSFGSAEGNTMVGDGSGLVQGVMKEGKAPEEDCYDPGPHFSFSGPYFISQDIPCQPTPYRSPATKSHGSKEYHVSS